MLYELMIESWEGIALIAFYGGILALGAIFVLVEIWKDFKKNS